MSQDWERVRAHKRIFFSKRQDVRARFTAGKKDLGFRAKVLDLSLGGLGCSMRRNQGIHLAKGVRLNLGLLGDGADWIVAADTPVEIRWILDIEGFDHIGFGCRFIDLDPSTEKALRQVINEELERRNRSGKVKDTIQLAEKVIKSPDWDPDSSL